MAVQDTAIKLGETIVYLVQVCYYQDADFSIFAGRTLIRRSGDKLLVIEQMY